jgi:surface carbohydrate biosynthesis protein
MHLIYGSKSYQKQNDIQYVNDANLSLPFGITYFEKSVPFIDNLSYQKCLGKILPELFSYQNYSLWWLILPSLSYSIIDSINFIDKFDIFLKKNEPNSVKIVDNFEKFYLVKQLCKKNKINFSYSKSAFFKYSIKNKFKIKFREKYYSKILQKKFKNRLTLFKNKSNKIPEFQNKLIIFSANVYRRKYFDSITNSEISREFILDPLIPKIKNLDLVGIDVDYSFNGETEILEQRLRDSISWIPLETILNKIPDKNKSKLFVSSYKKIISNNEFQNLFCYQGINFWSRIESDFKKISTSYYLPFLIDMIEKFEKFLQISKPASILIPYEKGSYALALIIACKKLDIKTIGIQHGAFDSLGHNDYTHTYLQSKKTPFGMPIPTHMLVWGNSSKNFLIKKGYPKNKISVIGNPEFYEMKNVKKDQNVLRTKFNFSNEKKIILFTTSKLQRGYISDEKRAYDEFVLEELLNLYSNNPNYIIILKPHPVKEPTYVYEKIIKKYNAKNCFIKTENILELIQLSDLLISVESSTIIDAIALEKMVIEITFDGSSWMDPKIAKNILILSELKNLKINIEKILHDKKLQNIFNNEQKLFLLDHYNFPNTQIDEILNNVINS